MEAPKSRTLQKLFSSCIRDPTVYKMHLKVVGKRVTLSISMASVLF